MLTFGAIPVKGDGTEMHLSPTTLPAAQEKGKEAMVVRACPTPQNILRNQYDLEQEPSASGVCQAPRRPFAF